MAFAIVQTAEEGLAASATTIVTPSLTISAGHLLVAWVKHEGAATTITPSGGGGGNSWQSLTKTTHANGDTHGQFFYVLSCASGTYGFTATFGAARVFRSAILFDCSYSGTASFDQQAGASGTTTGDDETISSGNLTTTGTDEIVFGGYSEYSTDVLSGEAVNGQAADSVVPVTGGENFTVAWAEVFSGTFTGAATAVMENDVHDWIVRAAAFKATGGGGGTPTPTVPPTMVFIPGRRNRGRRPA